MQRLRLLLMYRFYMWEPELARLSFTAQTCDKIEKTEKRLKEAKKRTELEALWFQDGTDAAAAASQSNEPPGAARASERRRLGSGTISSGCSLNSEGQIWERPIWTVEIKAEKQEDSRRDTFCPHGSSCLSLKVRVRVGDLPSYLGKPAVAPVIPASAPLCSSPPFIRLLLVWGFFGCFFGSCSLGSTYERDLPPSLALSNHHGGSWLGSSLAVSPGWWFSDANSGCSPPLLLLPCLLM